MKRAGSDKLAMGFLRAAYIGYKAGEAFGVCQMLTERYPSACPEALGNYRLPSQWLGMGVSAAPLPPAFRRASLSASNETTASPDNASNDERLTDNSHIGDDVLDTIT